METEEGGLTEEQEGHQFKEHPRIVIFDVEKDRVFVSERVDGLEDEGGHQGAEKRTPQGLQGEVVADL